MENECKMLRTNESTITALIAMGETLRQIFAGRWTEYVARAFRARNLTVIQKRRRQLFAQYQFFVFHGDVSHGVHVLISIQNKYGNIWRVSDKPLLV